MSQYDLPQLVVGHDDVLVCHARPVYTFARVRPIVSVKLDADVVLAVLNRELLYRGVDGGLDVFARGLADVF